MRKIFVMLLIVAFHFLGAQERWMKLNGPEGGGIWGIFSIEDTIVVGTGYPNGSIFFSIDRGSSWHQSKFKNKVINDFVNTGDGGIIAAVSSNGLYKSYDLKNWIRIFENGEEYRSLGRDHSGNVYAGTENHKIYKSKDNGLTWHLSGASTAGRIINFYLHGDSTLFCSAGGQILSKKSNSENWDILMMADDSYYSFSSDDSLIYANSWNSVFASHDTGKTWKNLDTNRFFSGNFLISSIFNNRLIVACDDETGFFGSGWGVAVSDDNGLTWRWSNSGIPPKLHATHKLIKSQNDTYVGTWSAGVYKSIDFGDSWFSVNNGLYAADVRNIAFDNKMNLYAACYSNGLFKSSDYGATWERKSVGFNNSYLWSVVSDDNGILLAGAEPGTYRSTDSGESWQQINNEFFILLYKDKLNRFYGMSYGNGIQRSTDAGNSWTRLDKGFINGLSFGLAFDSADNIYAGTRGGAIYKSTDDGSSWLKIYQSSATNSVISTIAVAPNGYTYANNLLEGILRSTDGGNSWQVVKVDPGNQNLGTLAINSKGEIFASGSNSKFVSSVDSGNKWLDVTDNLTLTRVNDIKLDKDGNMFLATDESVWRSNPDYPVNITREIKPEFNYSLEQNYPNPFNPSTSIKYSIKQREYVSLDIYDVLGNKISSLLNEEKEAGVYEVNWNADKYSSGVYFYQLKAGSFIETRKMLLIK